MNQWELTHFKIGMILEMILGKLLRTLRSWLFSETARGQVPERTEE